MRVLVAEDDFASRKFLSRILSQYGECDITVSGTEAVDAFRMALEIDEAYDLICLDIMMPHRDGYEVLKEIRSIEKRCNIPEKDQVKIIMTTGLNEGRSVIKAFHLGCTAYAGKPIDQEKFKRILKKLELI